jgi:gamma-glutamylcyclotransferase (GGCT)/AIG2-like uncharacterized protein YtfP
LVIAGERNVPYLLWAPDHGEFVRGEIYSVDDRKLSQLDDLEGHPNRCDGAMIHVLVLC